MEGMKVSEVYSSAESKARVFKWIHEKLLFLEQKSTVSTKDGRTFDAFKKELIYNVKKLINMCP